MRVRLKGINSVPKRPADGTVKTFWVRLERRPPLRGEPGSLEFVASYHEAVATKVAPARGTLFGILQQYQASEDFRGLADITRRSYVALIARIEKAFGDFPLAALTDRRTRGVFMAWRDKIAVQSGRRQADYAWIVLASLIAAIGLPNAMTQMVNTVKDHIPMLVAVASAGQDVIGRDGVQDYDFQESMLAPITKWRWTAQSTKGIPETTRPVAA
jgi:Thiamine pyrophosphate enzyme, N-terminal TPP binding domain